MADYSNQNLDSTVKSAWEMAEDACFNYLKYITSSKTGYNCAIGDEPTETKNINIWTFMLSGGPEQIQNFQCVSPNRRFKANGILQGVYEARRDALEVAGMVLNGMPVYWTADITDTNLPHRGIEPNVSLFEITEFPECFSSKEEGKKREWHLNIFFRCAFTDSEN